MPIVVIIIWCWGLLDDHKYNLCKMLFLSRYLHSSLILGIEAIIIAILWPIITNSDYNDHYQNENTTCWEWHFNFQAPFHQENNQRDQRNPFVTFITFGQQLCFVCQQRTVLSVSMFQCHKDLESCVFDLLTVIIRWATNRVYIKPSLLLYGIHATYFVH